MSQSFSSSFCRFDGPDHWRAVPGLGLVEAGSAGVKRSAVVMESWVDPPVSAAEFVARQRAAFPELERPIETVEGASLGAGGREVHLATYRSPLPSGDFLVQKQLTTATGPLVCTLTVSGRQSDASEWGPHGDRMLDSFTVEASRWAQEIRHERVLGSAARGAGPNAAVRSIGLALPVPAGWVWDEGGMALRRGETATIAVRRSGLPAASAEECFAEALARLGRSEDVVPSRWDRGETRAGAQFWALEASGRMSRTWGKGLVAVHREAYVDDEGVIAFTLDAAGNLEDADAAFAAVVGAYAWLPPETQALRTGESWLHAELPGHWEVVGTGVYARQSPSRLIVQVMALPRAQPAAKLGPGQASALRSSPDVVAVRRDEEEAGTLYGRPAYRFALDHGTPADGVSGLRCVWIDGKDACYHFSVQGEDPATVSQILSLLVAGVDPDGMGP
jgi:hypothetical protein